MASELQMSPQLEQIHGEIKDNFRALSNGFQRLNNIKDSNRQSKQLEELTGRMKECKRLIKEFDREIKVEESKNPPEVNKQLNDEKQSMIKELNSYVQLRKTYMNSLDNKRVELFDMGAGASEPMAEENVRMASVQLSRYIMDQWFVNYGVDSLSKTQNSTFKIGNNPLFTSVTSRPPALKQFRHQGASSGAHCTTSIPWHQDWPRDILSF